MSKNKRVVVTGIGVLCSLGTGIDQIWKNIISEKTNVRQLNNYVFGKYSENFLIHKIDDFNIDKFNFDKALIDEMKAWKDGEEVQDLYYLLAGVKLALEDSMIKYEGSKKIGLVLSHENPGLEQFCSYIFNETYKLYIDNKSLNSEEYFNILNEKVGSNVNDLQTFMFLYYVARTFKIHGYSIFINNACASGLYAIEAASQAIKNGISQAVVVASSEHPAIYKYLWFKKLGFLSLDGIIRPFDKNRNGFICGEGGTAIILEDYNSAIKRNAKIYGEYLGGGFYLESWKRTLPSPYEDFREKAIKDSLTKGRIEASEVDAVNAHGLGSQTIDKAEAIAISKIFKQVIKKPFITAYKPYVGHTLGNCALLETVLLLLNLKNNLLLPILNLENLDTELDLNVVRSKLKTSLKTVMKTSWGFGGYNAAAIFRKVN